MSAQPQAAQARVDAFRATAHRPGSRLRVLPIPDTEPAPLPRAPLPASMMGSTAYVQGELAVDFGSTGESGRSDGFFEPQPTASSELPDAARYADRLVRLVLETMDGTRPSRQLHHWVEPSIHERLTAAGVLARRRRVRPRPHRVLAVRVCEPVDGVAEVAVVVRTGGRTRAMALRLAGLDGRWLLTALEIG